MTYIDDREKLANIENKAGMIWSIADKLTGAYKPHEYGLVILPFTVLRRLDCALDPVRDAVLARYEEIKMLPEDMIESLLKETSGLDYYSLNRKGLRSVLENPKDIAGSLRRFIANFSKNVREVLDEFKIQEQIARMESTSSKDSDLLYAVIEEITLDKNDLSPSKVSDIDMGYIFEEIIRRFSESYNEDAGQHYTPRDAIDLMVEILVCQEDRDATKETARTVLDCACGTGGMLSEMTEYMSTINTKVHLHCSGQEYNPETYAICKANTLMKGNSGMEFWDIRKGDTLSDYQFKGKKFNYVIMNPPFGREWKVEEDAVRREAADPEGRFRYGLPAIGDSQMLFLSSAISSLESPKEGDCVGGRIAIIHNSSPLFVGDAGSGPSEIRRYILENDLLDAIIALPENLFYNTGIGTYIWVLDNNKEERRRGKVQLIDASKMYEIRRRSVGKKRFDIERHHIDTIVEAYRDYSDAVYGDGDKVCESRIADCSEFGYVKISIISPIVDENGTPKKNSKGKIVFEKANNDSETVKLGKIPLSSNKDLLKNPTVRGWIEDYMDKEVRPFIKYAEIDPKKMKIGYEIPFTRYFFRPEIPRPSEDIMGEIHELLGKINDLVKELDTFGRKGN